MPGEEYDVVDFNGDGIEPVQLDGSRSHTHYTESNPIRQGRLVYMNWFNNATKVSFASSAKPLASFPVGVTTVGLSVRDNSGDSHTAYTQVIVRRPIQDGVQCYYYEGDTGGLSLDNDPKKGMQAIFARRETSDIAFFDLDAFPTRVRNSPFQMRCMFVVKPLFVRDEVSFSVTHVGDVRLVVNDTVVLQSSSSSDEITTSGSIPLTSETYHSAQLLYASSGQNSKVILDVSATDSVDSLQYDASKVTPVIVSIEPLTSTLEGGGFAKLVGVGLENNVRVDFGGVDLAIDSEKSNDKAVFVQVPSSSTARRVNVRLFNNAGYSNSVAFEYQPNGKPPIIFRASNLTTDDGSSLNVQLMTGIKYGPDHRYYVSAIHSAIYSFATDANMQVLHDSICRSSSMGENRAVLGLAFNPADDPDDFNLYASASVLEWKDKDRLSGPLAWANGLVILVRKNVNGACLGKVKNIITGLPVTNHDHGVNALAFDQDGRLHIQVGGFTNAGVLDEARLGGLAANPLSGASLVADITNPSFDGDIKYSSSNPAVAVQTSGDVFVYMAGFRNSFGITQHSNGQMYCSDNGASVGFGAKSTSCDTHSQLYGENLADELVRLVEGKYAGHPNRNRGRTDKRQCVFRGPDEESDGFYQGPMATFESSTDGIVEYHARTFDSQLKGELLLTKFATQDSEGKVFRVRLSQDGTNVVSGPDELFSMSGLSVEISPYGDIVSPRVFGKRIVVLSAKRSFNRLVPTFLAVTPFRGPRKGGNWVMVTGEDFTPGAIAVFNGKACMDTQEVSEDGRSFMCQVPPAASGVTRVSVALRFDDSRRNIAAKPGVDYVYMRK